MSSPADDYDPVESFLAHYGVIGMRWGIRKRRSVSPAHPVSEDAARSSALKVQVRRHGTQSLSNSDLQALVTRLNLENQYGKLNPENISSGKRFMRDVFDVTEGIGKQQASSFGNKYAAKGLEYLIKRASAK